MILLVDDDRDTCRIMGRLLRGAGYLSQSAYSGESALSMLEDPLKPELVLLDVMMPGMSGVDVLRHIRASAALADLPVVICSATNDPGDLKQLRELGIQGYLQKGSCDLAKIIAAIQPYAGGG